MDVLDPPLTSLKAVDGELQKLRRDLLDPGCRLVREEFLEQVDTLLDIRNFLVEGGAET